MSERKNITVCEHFSSASYLEEDMIPTRKRLFAFTDGYKRYAFAIPRAWFILLRDGEIRGCRSDNSGNTPALQVKRGQRVRLAEKGNPATPSRWEIEMRA